jgi:plasmid rolling circle replication initiator protein Rep
VEVVSPVQLQGGKLPPVPRAGFAAGDVGGKGARAARYVHNIGTSSKACAWRGLSRDGAEITRRNRRDKFTQQVVTSLNRCGREKQAKALATCGQYFDVWVRPGGEAKLLPCPCDSMFCPDCANRRSRPLIRKLSTMVNRPARSYWFLTLTVPNVENLSRWNISEISDQFAELWGSWVFQEFEDENGVTRKIFGGVRSIECVYEPESRSWHPHIHVLFEGPKRLPWWWLVLLKAAWNRITGDARYLYLQRAYVVTKRGKKKFNHLNDKALREVCKYVTKSAEFAGDHLLVDEFLKAFKRVRRLQCFGSFHGAGAGEFEREPGEESPGISEEGARLSDDGYVRLPFRAHLADTEMRSDGSRQLTFDFMERVTAYLENWSPPWELTAEVPASSEQKRIGFPGVMPEKSEQQPSLFEGAA